jgi:hypothetical protein
VHFLNPAGITVAKGVGLGIDGVGELSESSLIADNMGREGKVPGGGSFLGEPTIGGHEQYDHGTTSERKDSLSQSITPSLTKPAGFKGLQATSRSTTGHPVGDSVGELMDDDVVLHGTVSWNICEGPNKHATDTRSTVGRGGELSVVGTSGILD